jgi:hypothetical protein
MHRLDRLQSRIEYGETIDAIPLWPRIGGDKNLDDRKNTKTESFSVTSSRATPSCSPVVILYSTHPT